MFSLFQSHRIGRASKVTLVIETREKSLGETAREFNEIAVSGNPFCKASPGVPWDSLNPMQRGRWESVAAAVIDSAVERGIVRRL